MSVLVLGGTAEARDLAARLLEAGVPVLSSLAGRVQQPRLPVGDVRVGGFGGAMGLREHLVNAGHHAVVDATHPFAAQISAHAAQGCASAGVPLLRLQRPGWLTSPGAADWHWVDGHGEAARVAATLGERPFLTVGRQSLADFTRTLADLEAMARVVDDPGTVPTRWRLLLDRGPFGLDAELEVMREHHSDVLVTKDSGGSYTRPKLDAAAQLGIPVVVVRRPAAPSGVRTVPDVDQAVTWVRSLP
ncbi:cobalt-precorrin-6A reductase [Nocardioides sp. KIGAM211]|uniref:Cobalt-precorrin-6A reductase n=1 Tax=Nocardioides luti TaxID=2761101 RepID=A0A7X0RKE3_9ACTN|nr:cobalt-precorrin-6A reductase [Nocardioides luti]MBB6629800.1 cobalt-precorrin-6A reductase [Nocardioides luti]